jgi:hypothetical protein
MNLDHVLFDFILRPGLQVVLFTVKTDCFVGVAHLAMTIVSDTELIPQRPVPLFCEWADGTTLSRDGRNGGIIRC